MSVPVSQHARMVLILPSRISKTSANFNRIVLPVGGIAPAGVLSGPV
jgi:hypothetical protein